ncbi:DNA topoisomerase VI subunit B [archaeon]|nr:DNA topoisomerase VI subunit B [archaeon]
MKKMVDKKSAEYFATQQKEISVSEFFEKNKHLLGFDNPTKALLIVVKEAVDNALDACEEAGILPDIKVKVKNKRDDVFTLSIEDNGPGIVKQQIPKIFGKLLYGSKFHKFKQSRGQQGIGISAAVLYAQLTTGVPAKVYSKLPGKDKTHVFIMHIDTMKNEPEIIEEYDIKDGREAIKEHGVRIVVDVVGRYRKKQGIDEYIRQSGVANPFANFAYSAPDGEKIKITRSVKVLPKEAKSIKPHPYGVEFGILLRMLKNTKAKTIYAFLQNEFSSTGATSSMQILKVAKIDKKAKPLSLERDDIDRLIRSMQTVKLQRPPLDCLSPIGKEELEKGLRKQYPDADFIFTESRKPVVYRGIPFIIETGIVYGGSLEKEKSIDVIRLANRVPLLYQLGAGAVNDSVVKTSWRRYGLTQSGKSMPSGPVAVVVHMCSAWVPFISESKEAMAPYPDIVKEMKLAIQNVARQLYSHLRKKQRAKHESRRMQIFEEYLPLIAENAAELAEIKKKLNILPIIQKVVKTKLLENERGAIDHIHKEKKGEENE